MEPNEECITGTGRTGGRYSISSITPTCHVGAPFIVVFPSGVEQSARPMIQVRTHSVNPYAYNYLRSYVLQLTPPQGTEFLMHMFSPHAWLVLVALEVTVASITIPNCRRQGEIVILS